MVSELSIDEVLLFVSHWETLPVARIFSDNCIEEIEKIILDKIWKKDLQQQDSKALLKK